MPNLNRLNEILTENLSMNKARITCLSLMIIALITAQSSNLKKIARHIPKAGKTDSHYRRLQRFIGKANIDYDQLAVLIYQLFGLGKVTLTIDRTNWKWGKANINIFMLGVVYQGIAIPLYWEMLDKRGNTNQLERKDIIQRFIKRFGKDNINIILADREFVGATWFNWLNDNNIPFAIRIKKSSKVSNHHGKQVQIKNLFHHVTGKETYRHGRILIVDGCRVRVFAKRDKENGLVIVATNQRQAMDAMTNISQMTL